VTFNVFCLQFDDLILLTCVFFVDLLCGGWDIKPYSVGLLGLWTASNKHWEQLSLAAWNHSLLCYWNS